MAIKQEFVTFGPFVLRDLEPIREYLEGKRIEHRVRVDQVDIDSRALLTIGDDLEKFGISWKPDLPEPDFRPVEEYVCAECLFTASGPDHCPIHRKPLLKAAEWNRIQRDDREQQWERRLWKISIALAALAVLFAVGAQTYRRLRPWLRQHHWLSSPPNRRP